MERLERSLQLHFAALTALGGLMMVSGEVGVVLPTVAVVAAVVAFLAVDLWKIVYLPTAAAYLGMIAVAAYCMAEFLWLRTEAQLTVVAQLLVLVEAVLLFQRKTIRVFEQIGVFCLLELVVAAVFNSAVLFGLLLIPFSVIGLRALVLLQSLSTAQALAAKVDGGIRTSASDSVLTVASHGIALPRAGIIAIAPAVVLIAAMFFYALPRATGDSAVTRVGGRVTTGFSDTMTLDQAGELLQNKSLVMRLSMLDRRSGAVYLTREPIYLRGQVLEQYAQQSGIGYWRARQLPPMRRLTPLPPRDDTAERQGQRLYDHVEVRVDLQPLTDRSLFAIAPYHRLRDTPGVEHLRGQWLLTRYDYDDYRTPERFRYRFGTHGFRDGRQTRLVRYFGPHEAADGDQDAGQERRRNSPRAIASHVEAVARRMLEFDSLRMPTVASEARRIAVSIGERADSPFWVSQAIEDHFSRGGGFQYTLDLTADRNAQLDPIEQFVARDRRGHCQYFASAMAMMLRSQNIPARVVVGYKTDEYNPLGNHYLVRQLHAHAWVEALIDEDEIPASMRPSGQPATGPYLVRFDPTPERDRATPESGSVARLYDFAEALWSQYVLDMNGERRNETLFGRGGNDRMVGAYANVLTQLRQIVSGIDARSLGAGALADHGGFSWRAALGGMAAMLALLVIIRIDLRRIRAVWRGRRRPVSEFQSSSVVFYQRLCDLLARVELHRKPGQTPLEFVHQASQQLAAPAREAAGSAPSSDERNAPFHSLVALFYQVRYGGNTSLDAGEAAAVERSLEQIEGMVHRATHSPEQ